jgi:hypothetical protein
LELPRGVSFQLAFPERGVSFQLAFPERGVSFQLAFPEKLASWKLTPPYETNRRSPSESLPKELGKLP